MAENQTEKKARTPRTPELITKGALELPLEDRVKLAKLLKTSIDNEVKALNDAACKASEMAAALAGPVER